MPLVYPSLSLADELEVLDHIGDVDVLAIDSRFGECVVQYASRRADEHVTRVVSASPGCSPTKTNEVCAEPSPKTFCVARRDRADTRGTQRQRAAASPPSAGPG